MVTLYSKVFWAIQGFREVLFSVSFFYKCWYKLEVSQVADITELENWQRLALNSDLFDSSGHFPVKLLHCHHGYEFKKMALGFQFEIYYHSGCCTWMHHCRKLRRQHIKWERLNHKDRVKSSIQWLYCSLLDMFTCWRYKKYSHSKTDLWDVDVWDQNRCSLSSP